MIHTYLKQAGRLALTPDLPEHMGDVAWLDLIEPTQEEETRLEALLGIDLPTKDDMEEIEISSRLYTEEGGIFMTAILPSQIDGDNPKLLPVSFVLTNGLLITVRYHEPRAFVTFPARAAKVPMGCDTGIGVLVALLETIVDRLADILERDGRDIDTISREVFRPAAGKPMRSRNFQHTLEAIGRKGDLISNIRESLMTLERLAGFLAQQSLQSKASDDIRERIKTLSSDIRSLNDHASYLSQKITFLLDATLGLINIEQNAIIKIFSVAAVVFLPPTLIASIYGMNFQHMPELEWLLGYPWAIGMMIFSAILPYVYFKHRGWL